MVEVETEKFSFIVKFDFDNGENELDGEYPEKEIFEEEFDMQKNLIEQIANLIRERRGVENCPIVFYAIYRIEHIDWEGQTSDYCWQTHWFKKHIGHLNKKK